MTPVKYECDWKNITFTFVISKILPTDELTNGPLLTLNPGQLIVNCHCQCLHLLLTPKPIFTKGD